MKDSQTEARRWFKQPQADRDVVRTLIVAGYHAAACFHSQQVAEKALKAILYAVGSRIVLGHSVWDLVRRCAEVDPALAQLASDGAFLDQFYIPTRYPNGLPSPAVPSEMYTVSQAQTALESAERILHLVDEYLHLSGSQDSQS
jgi:HEPN domain-containing protein